MTVRVVYDTNVLVSAVLKADSLPALVLGLALRRHVTLCLSPSILTEYRDVLQRPKFGFAAPAIQTLLDELTQGAVMVTPATNLTVASDEADNRFLECAQAAQALYLVTGNARHFPASPFQGTHILSPAEFITRMGEVLA